MSDEQLTITPGWYRTRNGGRAFVGAITPESIQPSTLKKYYSIGWMELLHDGTWFLTGWTIDGRYRGDIQCDHDHDLIRRDDAAESAKS